MTIQIERSSYQLVCYFLFFTKEIMIMARFINNAVVDPNKFCCKNPKPGVYMSDKGSVLIKPQNNVTDRGNEGSQSDHVMILDVDTGRLIMKQCADVKATYNYVGDVSQLDFVLNPKQAMPAAF